MKTWQFQSSSAFQATLENKRTDQKATIIYVCQPVFLSWQKPYYTHLCPDFPVVSHTLHAPDSQ